ncbi:hypothetical protein QUA70_14415 [Microcoleus sp. LAD1_D5]|uniref:hypothetical protein n=1 Tax=Microcoleus sp. LAD1_D3 TaxID=2819365 RepID=UPI002FCF2321
MSGRRKFGNEQCTGCNGCNGCREDGRWKMEEEEILVPRFYLETHLSLAVPRHF